MSAWLDRIIGGFDAALATFCIVSDPDGVLLDERILTALAGKDFEVLPFDDTIAFRVEFEERYRAHWDRGVPGEHAALILHTRSPDTSALPWDYLRAARRYRLSLAELLPQLSYTVIQQLDGRHLEALYEAQERHAEQVLGEKATQDFVLTHIYRIGLHLIEQPNELLAVLLRLHYRREELPLTLCRRLDEVIGEKAALRNWPIRRLFEERGFFLDFVQKYWEGFVQNHAHGRIAEGNPQFAKLGWPASLPFDHPDVRVVVDSLFLDGALQPLALADVPPNLPKWMNVGVTASEAAAAERVREACKSLAAAIPGLTEGYRAWLAFAQRQAELLARWGTLPHPQAQAVQAQLQELQAKIDGQFRSWLATHYGTLASLPVARSPVMVHHIARFLALRRETESAKVALIVMDGLALDQWVTIRGWFAGHQPRYRFEEHASFAWIPTVTSVSRQAIFSAMLPRGFAASIASTSQEPGQWSRFWQDHGLRAAQVVYQKKLRDRDQLAELDATLSAPHVEVAGLVVDAVDEIAHGAALGRRSVHGQIVEWCETGFLERLFAILLSARFEVFVTSDHGNVEAIGTGRPSQGVIAEERGERVRVYGTVTLREQSAAVCPDSFALPLQGIPLDFLPLFAPARTAFVPQGDKIVAHGGCSVEEVVVPFVQVSLRGEGL